jgi:hypothetical protein
MQPMDKQEICQDLDRLAAAEADEEMDESYFWRIYQEVSGLSR